MLYNDLTYNDTWKTRSESLNDVAYLDYLKSDEWKNIKSKALRRDFYKKCIKCGSNDSIELHHRNYKWIGTKKSMMGLIPLCRKCHNEVHDYAKINKVSIRIATNEVCKESYLRMYRKPDKT